LIHTDSKDEQENFDMNEFMDGKYIDRFYKMFRINDVEKTWINYYIKYIRGYI